MDPTSPTGPLPVAAVAPVARSLVGRIVAAVLVGGLGTSTGVTYVSGKKTREELASVRAEREQLEAKASAASELARKTQDAERETGKALDEARAALAQAEERVKAADAKGAAETSAALAEKAAAEKRIAELTDRLGQSDAARKAVEAHAKELDDLMELCRQKKVNVKRLVGLDAPPRVDLEVVETVTRGVPVLVLRAEGSLDGFEEGDKLYLTRQVEGRARETGQAVLEKIDRGNRLLSARVSRLDAGERVNVGDRLQTYPPP
jgi:chemotaxis protein histidine kinase CheA